MRTASKYARCRRLHDRRWAMPGGGFTWLECQALPWRTARLITTVCCLRSLRSLRRIRRERPEAGEVSVVSKRVELVSRLNAGSAAFVRYEPCLFRRARGFNADGAG